MKIKFHRWTKVKLLECTCCGFIAIVTKKTDHKDLICPTCLRMNCKKGSFVRIRKKGLQEDFYDLRSRY